MDQGKNNSPNVVPFPRHLSQSDVLASSPIPKRFLLMPRESGGDRDTATFSQAAAMRSGATRHIAYRAPQHDPGQSLARIGLQSIHELRRRRSRDDLPGAKKGVFARLGALGMAAAYFTRDDALAEAQGVLGAEFDFVPDFDLALPTQIKGRGVNAARGHQSPAARQWPAETGVAAAHRQHIRGGGVLIGVLDTGVDADHSEFVQNPITFRYVSFFPNHPLSPPRDTRGFDTAGHGTHVCGIIAGANIGVAPEARLAVASVIESETSRTSLIRVTYGLDWILRQFSLPGEELRPGIINLSLSFPTDGVPGMDPAEYQDRIGAIKRLLSVLLQANVLPITAIGNDGPGQYGLPGGFPEVLSVGAVDFTGKIAPFSGSHSEGASVIKPEIYGYGVDVYSSFERDYLGRSVYQIMSGTSMAAPYVTGIAALHLSREPALTASELRDLLLETALRPENAGPAIAGFRLA
jgi:hypothetical protein